MLIEAIAGLTWILIGMMMCAQNTTQADDRNQLQEIQQQLVKAWITRDRSILERLLAPEWMVTHADGRISTREQILREFDTGANRLIEGQVEDINVRLFDGFAIVIGRTHARGEYERQQYDVTLRFTDVFARRNRQWQAVASHATRTVAGDGGAGKTKAKI
jgi:uncharacterized protein DUF4440